MAKNPKADMSPATCFCCQRPLTSVEGSPMKATKEHYIPQWLFRQHDLMQQTMDLPSQTQIKYTSLWVPACAQCNGRLSTEVEVPVSDLILGPTRPWTGAERDLVKRWLAKVYLGVRVRATGLKADQKDPASPMIATQREVDEAVLLRMVVDGTIDVPHSSLFVYDCNPDTGTGFDFFSSEMYSVITLRSGSVGLACVLLDGQQVEAEVTSAHPLVSTAAQQPLDAPTFRMLGAYAMAAAEAAGVCHDVVYTWTSDGRPMPQIVQFIPHWTDGPTAAQVQGLAMRMVAIGYDIEWVSPA
jgi:hypothetical protein